MVALDAGLLSKAYSTLKHKTHTLSEEQLDAFEALSKNIEEAAARMKDDPTQMLEDVPEHFLGPVLYEIMKDPVLVPTSTIMDRHHIEQHLLNNTHDPYNMLVPQPELKAKMDDWIREQREKKRAQQGK